VFTSTDLDKMRLRRIVHHQQLFGKTVSNRRREPVHSMRFGREMDMKAIIAPSPDADRAVRYLTKYLTKAISDPLTDDDDVAHGQHLDRLHAELVWLPCSPRCANWLLYGVQPAQTTPGLIPGRCPSNAARSGASGRRRPPRAGYP
jgi:hypothetical protein